MIKRTRLIWASKPSKFVYYTGLLTLIIFYKSLVYLKVVYHSRKCMKMLGFLLKGRGGGGTLKLFFLQRFWRRDWEWYACTLSRGMGSRDYSRRIWIRFLIGKIVCRITLKVSPNCINLLCFGSFAGAGAHHQGLRRLKPCQFQRTVYWHCECDKLCSNARFELLAVCCSWTRGRKANGPSLTRLQSAFVEVPSKVESAWTTFGARFKAGQRRGQKIANCLEVDFPAQRYAKFPRMQ